MQKRNKYRIFKHGQLIADEGDREYIEDLVDDFKKYKNHGVNHGLFGRDAEFSENPTLAASNIWHVHVLEVDEFDLDRSQYQNTTDNFFLVYCVHPLYDDAICVIHVLTPEAHKKARQLEFVNLASKRAEEFFTYYESARLKDSA